MNRNEAERDTRKYGKHLRVPVLPSEELTIKENASKASLTVAEYLRRLSLGYEITSTLDSQYVAQIVKINADQGRLGGLLKLWLTDDAKLTACGTPLTPGMVRALLKRIEANQDEMLRLVQALKF
ncbi:MULTISPECIES: conjugal transfer transcriptional regulator TraJ [Pseudomonas]|uniref:Conjugal transfer transcriptional regulator TraJ n=1 Tax=Pseudomonas capeferrum TaxID=1495066 RepID=A0ABY7RAQ1_9PSED|nr:MULTISPECIES: conjugal transfer transcriptional regulator TraJ [Pseudomonas]MUT52701.1 conjugal transfer transcriptional regulator TraJ [Pseudomonas sp. TDA1]WCI00707.1 conjugal transfer transcriptional regulator TraJ [Pseudomonas capeferrum]